MNSNEQTNSPQVYRVKSELAQDISTLREAISYCALVFYDKGIPLMDADVMLACVKYGERFKSMLCVVTELQTRLNDLIANEKREREVEINKQADNVLLRFSYLIEHKNVKE